MEFEEDAGRILGWLLICHPPEQSAGEIADAIGIAEGTMFRVFSDKKSLIDAVLEAAMDTTRTEFSSLKMAGITGHTRTFLSICVV